MLQSIKMGRHYPARPVLGVGAVILRENEVLLVRRGREPLKGFWSLPGGVVEVGETLVEGVRREVREELGLRIRVGDIVEVFERITRDPDGRVSYHYVLVDYLCEVAGGDLQVGDDAESALWVDRSRISTLHVTEGTPAVIEKAFQLRERVSISS